MKRIDYKWKRFWCPRDGSIALTHDGYLEDPDTPWGRIQNPDVASFESISDVPCLVMLGEPGMGKTYAIRAEAANTQTKVRAGGGQVLSLNLGHFSSEGRLERKLFASREFELWVRGEHQLHLFLDSLDEGLLGINTLSSLLADELKDCPIGRLHLRIACRTAVWPNTLEDKLRVLWTDDKVGVYELAPLRLTDVAEAATVHGIEAAQFLQEISRVQAAPLATRPVTLSFLLKTFTRKGGFPNRRADLYEQGCELLCEESNESRKERGHKGRYSARQRLAVAARIAAVTVYGNRHAVWTGVNPADLPQDDVRLRDLCGGQESCGNQLFDVDEDAVTEALDTGLFSSRGPRRMGWAHQTYAEFLAASYLVRNDMTLSQVMSLLAHPGDPDGRLVPQLHETAAWLAAMRADVFNQILTTDPEVLLRSDVATAETASRAALVGALLKAYDGEKLLPPGPVAFWSYHKLAHPAIRGQLAPYISDNSKGVLVRTVAIGMAEACGVHSLGADLAQIALDASQPLSIRERAASAVNGIGDDQAKLMLKPLATVHVREDKDDELKAIALTAVWPDHISADKLFTVLTPPKNESLLGRYHRFLSDQLAWHLDGDQLVTALQWVERHPLRTKLPYAFGAAMDSIMLRGWRQLQEPGVLPAYARAALSRLRCHDQIVGGIRAKHFSDSLAQEADKRRQLVAEIIPLLSDPTHDPFWLTLPGKRLVGKDDLLWLIGLLKTTDSQTGQQIVAEVIRSIFDFADPLHQQAIYAASQSNEVLASGFSWLLRPILLRSPEAELARQRHQARLMSLAHRRTKPQSKDLPPQERVKDLIRECESVDSAAWWRLNIALMLEPGSVTYADELESDLTVLPGWSQADDQTRARIVNAARRYVVEQAPNTADGVRQWLDEQVLHRPTFAGYRALLLMMLMDPESVEALPQVAWKTWAPIIVGFPERMGTDGDDPHKRLMQTAYCHAPDEVIDTLMLVIQKQNEEGDHILAIRKLEYCWDDRLGAALLGKVKDSKLKPDCMGSLLRDLLLRKVEGARPFAHSLVPLPPPTRAEDRSRAVVAARALMCCAEDGGWSVVWPAILQDTEFGREVITGIAHTLDSPVAILWQGLSEDQLRELYVWLVNQYPYTQGPARTSVEELRDSIPVYLKQRGTPEACEAIRQIATQFPELPGLKRTLLEAVALARRNTWSPPQPSHILRMASDHNRRLVENGVQLLDVIAESIRRLEKKLQEGEPPAAIDLWNEVTSSEGTRHTPKDENRFSDYVKRHLEEDLSQRGIVVNREVQITRHDKTDIHVRAVTPQPRAKSYDSIEAIVECKGCWHGKLDTAMKTQLVDRYLKDSGCPNGLYLVGWFNCDRWQGDTARQRAAASAAPDIQHLQQRLEDQAAELSEGAMTVRALTLDAALS